MAVRVRFAPNPTGQIHIGNMRTAIFNWLFARRFRGKFLVRIEDADDDKATPETVQSVFDALEWLGLDHDEEPICQSSRKQVYLDAAHELLKKGWAYKGGSAQGESIIFGVPKEDVVFQDEIHGEMHKDSRDTADFVIVRSNGTPVFHLANVVDDIQMNITHVIRGEEHIENTYRHVALFRAFGADVPTYAHVPTVVNHQGKPYSKRDGAASVEDLREKGYLPDAVFNFMALLGWTPPDDREIMTRDEMIQHFDIRRVKSAPARVDITKLEWMNGEYLRTMPLNDFAAGFKAALRRGGLWNDSTESSYLNKVARLMQERTKTYSEVPYFAGFFFTEDFHYDDMALKNRLKNQGAKELLTALKEQFAALGDFNAAKIEEVVRKLASARGMAASQAGYPLRIAVSGILMGPALYEMLEVLGKDRVINRIGRTLQIL